MIYLTAESSEQPPKKNRGRPPKTKTIRTCCKRPRGRPRRGEASGVASAGLDPRWFVVF